MKKPFLPHSLPFLRNRVFLSTDVALLALAAYLSYVLRLDRFDLARYWSGVAFFAFLGFVIIPLIFWQAGVYSRYWRYASVDEMLLLTGCVTAGVVLVASIGLGVTRLVPDLPAEFVVPRSVPLIFLFLAVPATAGPRLVVRAAVRFERRPQNDGTSVPVLIMGAGDAGAIIVRELRRNPQLGMEVVGFVDDDLTKHDTHIHGVRVLGDRHDIPGLVNAYRVQQVIIAMPKAPGKAIREIVGICEGAGVKTKIMPGIYSLLDGTVNVSQLRSVRIEDLLRREPVQTDTAAVSELIRGRRVLVTGGGGSIGSELCRQVLRFQPAQLIVVGHGENSVFRIHNELTGLPTEAKNQPGKGVSSGATTSDRLRAVVADIRFADRLRDVFEAYQPEIVFHTAAHKHVPLMELNPAEAITNNILGTRNLLDVALQTGVHHFVMISTDKAVNPSSIMGASKRVAELLVHRAARASGKPYVAVRFGNVLGSRGSVVPIFEQQVAQGGPVTVTHPEMRRYFMTIPEAVQLVLQSAVLGQGGEVFVLDMGEPVRIVDLAKDLIRLSGLEEGRDIDIVFTGVRPGEKLFEELFVPGEVYHRTRHEKIFIAGNASSFVTAHLDEQIAVLVAAAQRNDAPEIVRALRDLIPEYRPASVDGEDTSQTTRS
jgi:FlaA1/EpsC-like NDP-sugar epimerase